MKKDKKYVIETPNKSAKKGKDKQHKKYEFGNKVGLVTTSIKNFILSCVSFKGNTYDGHTLKSSISLAEEAVDLGYRGHNY